MTPDTALARISAQVVQLTPGVRALVGAGKDASEQLAALVTVVGTAFVALQVQLHLSLIQTTAATREAAQARRSSKASRTAAKPKQAQAKPRRR